MIMSSSRRHFLRSAAQAAGSVTLSAAVPSFLTARPRRTPPSDQVNVGLIGCNNRGFHVLQNHLRVPGVNCLALCDIDANVLNKRAAELETTTSKKPARYGDFRRLLEDKAIDAVIIGTPDHWHCLPTVYACQAGKDVYVEKPLANSIGECELMVRATHRYRRIVQVGQQQRSSETWLDVMDYLRSGKLGRVQKADIWGNFNYGLGPLRQPDAPAPAGVDYDLFLGPAPARPFNPARFHGSWRFFWDYGGGLITDWGVHLLDMGLWAKDLAVPPDSVVAQGRQYDLPERSRETHDLLTAVFTFGDYVVQWEHNAGKQVGPYGRSYGVAFIGENGTLVADRSKWEVYPEWDDTAKKEKMEKFEPRTGQHGHPEHAANFIACIKSRQEPACPVEIGRAAAVTAHMANVALRSGSYHLQWDESAKTFTNNPAANAMIVPEYRKPWSWPVV